jgi:hypothetical protein
MNRILLFSGGVLLTVVFGIFFLLPQPVAAADSFIGKVSVVASPNPNKDGSCPENIDFEVTVEISKKPLYGLYNWETSVDGGKTWSSLSYSTLMVEKDSEDSSLKIGLQLPVPDTDKTDGARHVYKVRWVYAYGSHRAVSKPAVFVCGH